MQALCSNLRADVAADRQELEDLMARLHLTESAPRKATAWLGEKMIQIKRQLDDPIGGALRLLEGLDALLIGIEGKRGLWQALKIVAKHQPELGGLAYPRLIQRLRSNSSVSRSCG